MSNETQAIPQSIDIEELLGKIDGLTQQRNSAYDDAANVFARFNKLTKMFNNLLADYQRLKTTYEPDTAKPPADEVPEEKVQDQPAN